jgi:hypothetical protein
MHEGLRYSGLQLDVSEKTDAELRWLFPELDVSGIYRDADSWLHGCAARRRPRKVKRFLLNWFKRERQKFERQERKQAEIRRELMVG